ncbi:MAG TPA: hypothetical protein VHY20_10650 [Pirellulales bacterium]|jgi:hypothetical protein|nr:hypothetical protein [Pirellulales bacterium]
MKPCSGRTWLCLALLAIHGSLLGGVADAAPPETFRATRRRPVIDPPTYPGERSVRSADGKLEQREVPVGDVMWIYTASDAQWRRYGPYASESSAWTSYAPARGRLFWNW